MADGEKYVGQWKDGKYLPLQYTRANGGKYIGGKYIGGKYIGGKYIGGKVLAGRRP